MKSILDILWFLAITFLSSLHASAQRNLILYSSYSDYTDQKGEVYEGDYKSRVYTSGVSIKLVDTKSKKKIKFKSKDYWGFKYGGALFRTNPKSKLPQRVITVSDDFVYYENGIAYINLYSHGRAVFPRGLGYSYISRDLESDIHQLPSGGGSIGILLQSFRRFREENPKVEPLFECIDGKYRYKHVRRCVERITGQSILSIDLTTYIQR